MPHYSVDVAGPETDRQQLQDICLLAAKNLPYMQVEPDPSTLAQSIEYFCNCDLSQGVCFLLLADGEVVGFLAAHSKTAHPLMLHVPIAHELCWFVHPDHRGRDSLVLVSMFEDWAKTIGSKVIVVGHFEDEVGEVLKKVYKAKGYRPIEHCYMKEID